MTRVSSLERVSRQPRQPWQELAACVGEFGAWFYPPLHPEKKMARLRREARAVAVCQGCPVRDDCLAYAVEQRERYGIWGGLTGLERRSLLIESSAETTIASSPDWSADPTAESTVG